MMRQATTIAYQAVPCEVQRFWCPGCDQRYVGMPALLPTCDQCGAALQPVGVWNVRTEGWLRRPAVLVEPRKGSSSAGGTP